MTALAAVVLAALVAPVAGLVLALAVLAGLVVAPAVARALAGPGAAAAAAAGARDVAVVGLVDGLAELTAYGATGTATTAAAVAERRYVRAQDRPARAAAIATTWAGAAGALALPLAVGVGGLAATAGRISPVTVSVLVACVLAAFDAIAPVPTAFAAWARFRAALTRVADVLTLPVPLAEPLQPAWVPAGPLGLAAQHVDVAPAPGLPPVVTDCSFVLRPGERVAVTGPSGCGKSTLLGAVLRTLPVQDGRLVLRGGPPGRPDDVRVVDVAAPGYRGGSRLVAG